MTEPTARQKVLYYSLGLTPPADSRDWVERDIHSAGWQIRRVLQVCVGVTTGAIVAVLLSGMLPPTGRGVAVEDTLIRAAIAGLILGILQATIMADYFRRRTLAYHDKKWTRQLTR